MLKQNKNWYLVYCKPKKEFLAKEHLARQCYEVYLPLARFQARRRGKYNAVIRPLFPRYLFICLVDDDNWQPIRFTQGVHSLVQFGATAGRVPTTLISTLKAAENAEGLQELAAPSMQIGAKVSITQGPMAGYDAVFMAQNDKQRITVLLEIMGRYTRIHLEQDAVRPADD